MRNIPKEVGLGSVEKVLKLALSTKNVKERFEFAKMHKDRTIHWKRVIFNNETRINLLCCNGISWC